MNTSRCKGINKYGGSEYSKGKQCELFVKDPSGYCGHHRFQQPQEEAKRIKSVAKNIFLATVIISEDEMSLWKWIKIYFKYKRIFK